jgi:hypothetical protein
MSDLANAKLAAARADEKEARRLRKEGRDFEAADTYENARGLYADARDVCMDEGEDELALTMRQAADRCNRMAQNLRHPKSQRPTATTPRPNCLSCKKPLRRFRHDGLTFGDGTPREWGDYGDHRFCGLRCGHNWACAHAPRSKTK